MTNERNLTVLKQVKQAWFEDENFLEDNLALFPDIPHEDLVVSHCDAQENNILLPKHDLTKCTLIDFEYIALSCQEWDLANHFNEMIWDNCHDESPWVKIYKNNFPSISEIRDAVSFYLGLKYEHKLEDQEKDTVSKEEYVTEHIQQTLTNLFKCMILNNIYWGVWGILMLKDEDVNKDVFNFGFGS